MNETIKLSPTRLNVFVECPRCFWLMCHHPETRPKNGSLVLYSMFDIMHKEYYDKHRKKGLPPLLKGKIPFKLVDQETSNNLRKYLKEYIQNSANNQTLITKRL